MYDRVLSSQDWHFLNFKLVNCKEVERGTLHIHVDIGESKGWLSHLRMCPPTKLASHVKGSHYCKINVNVLSYSAGQGNMHVNRDICARGMTKKSLVWLLWVFMGLRHSMCHIVPKTWNCKLDFRLKLMCEYRSIDTVIQSLSLETIATFCINS